MGFLDAVGGSIIEAPAQLAGAAMGGKAQKKAAQMQQQSTREALAFEKEKEARRQADYDKAYGIWQAGRQALAQRYGLPIEAVGLGGPPAAGGAAPGGAAQRGASIRDIIQPGGGEVNPNPQLPSDLGKWDDWRNYGLRNPGGA